jgi:hypothetical protein
MFITFNKIYLSCIVMENNSIVEFLNNIFDYAGKNFVVLKIILYALYFVTFFGIIAVNPTYIDELRWIMQVVICVFLMYRFNPFVTHTLKRYDANIIFSSAVFLLINTGLVEIFNRYWKELPINSITK